jgi:predicted Holliday junction resolvase-like endonuclease
MAILDDIKKQHGLTIECPSCCSAFRASDAKLFDATKRLHGDALEVLRELQEQLEYDRGGLRAKRIAARNTSQTAARTSITGNVVEKIAAALPGFVFDAGDCRMLSEPIDLVVFKGFAARRRIDALGFVEIKSGRSRLTAEQHAIRTVVEAGNVELVVTEPKRV